jgi:putative membrane protein
MMWNQYDQFGWWWFVVMPLGMVGFWALVAWVVVTIVRGDRAAPRPASNAEAILAERYARGEIDSDEYDSTICTPPERRPSTGHDRRQLRPVGP